MVTTIHFFDNPTERQTLYEVSSLFLSPHCYAYAIALHRALGWPLLGLMKGDTIWHALVKAPEGLLDYRGIAFTEEDPQLGKPLGLSPPYASREISESDLAALKPVDEHFIALARTTAEALYPNYPWPDTIRQRMTLFADGLEELSRATGVWIRAESRTYRPILFVTNNDEDGYDLQPCMDGVQYQLDRRLQSD
jgi:hypothetical protein